ncbi:MAG TPA: sigma 54-interacting transcriptional regulator [Oligoflexia bacterium]|nr:sigma 54-interacting transcriptional regulator [Oligoflexia bacterium]HMP48917.1 sigma 54-interacting transcriptional regulator [Oligoflexia bacterium]
MNRLNLIKSTLVKLFSFSSPPLSQIIQGRNKEDYVLGEPRILRLFLFFRILMLGFFAGLQSGVFLNTESLVDTTFRLLCFGVILITVFQFWAIRTHCTSKFVAPFQLSVDVVLLTYVLSISGNTSSFVFYLVLIVCAALVTNAFTAILLSAFSGVCYALLITGYIASDGSIVKSASTTEIFTSYFALVLSALIAALYARRSEQFNRSYAEQEKRLQRAALEQEQLMNSLSEGVITLDIHSAITGVNEAASAILGLSGRVGERILGRDVGSVFRSLGLENVDALGGLPKEGSCELRLRKNEQEAVLRCTSFDIGTDSDVNATPGKILFISDVSELRSMESRLEFHEKMTRLLGSIEAGVALDGGLGFSEIIGTSGAFGEVRNIVSKVGPSDAPVLILGESGTGKEVIARALHKLSNRKKYSFVAVNCGAIPEALIESELFGHKKGSFTGATQDTKGLFREAERGTIFLDEIGELPLHLQAKLLRVLQDRMVRPVGSGSEIPVDVRIIAATNKNLREEVKNGRFREDLYYRLRVVEIGIPPLRERKEDIPQLVVYFLERDGITVGNGSCISPEAMDFLMKYDYPGNIRELENIVARARVLGGGVILPENLPEEVRFYKKSEVIAADRAGDDGLMGYGSQILPVDLENMLETLEKKYLQIALQRAGGRKKEAARLLGLNFRSFRYRLKKYQLADEEEDSDSTCVI